MQAPSKIVVDGSMLTFETMEESGIKQQLSDTAAGLAFGLLLASANLKATFFLPETNVVIHDNQPSLVLLSDMLLHLHTLTLSTGNLNHQISRKR